MTLGKLVNFSEPLFPLLLNAHITGSLRRFSDLTHDILSTVPEINGSRYFIIIVVIVILMYKVLLGTQRK